MIKKFLLSVVLIATSQLSYANECESLTRSGNDIIFYGDTHGFHTNSRLADHLKSEYSKEDLALFVHLGDIKNYGEPDLGYFFSRYEFLLDSNNNYSKEDKNVFVLGNHDFTDSLRILDELGRNLKKKELLLLKMSLKITKDGQTKAWLITLNTKHLDENKSHIYGTIRRANHSFFTHIGNDDEDAPLFIVSHEGYHDTHSLPSDIQYWFKKELPNLLKNEFPVQSLPSMATNTIEVF